jgi:AcrR family transcriptional regulator
MKEKYEDRRLRRTRQLLTGALIDLLIERRYDTITVQQIVDRAGVGRSTFYSHYRDKDDLLLRGFEPALEAFSALITVDDAGELQIMPALEFFTHAQENYHLFKALTRGGAIDLLFEKGQDYWSTRFEAQLKHTLPDGREPVVPLPVLSNYVAGTFLTLLKWWLRNDMPYSPQRMDQMFRQLITPSIEAALGTK